MKRLSPPPRLPRSSCLCLPPAPRRPSPPPNPMSRPLPPAKTPTQTAADEDRDFSLQCRPIGLMKQGRDFERAIALMRGLTEQYPQDRSYHLALGCAYTCHLAAIGDAMAHPLVFAEDQEKYKQLASGMGSGAKRPQRSQISSARAQTACADNAR